MAFSKKTWLDRLSQYPTRRTLTAGDGTTKVVDVTRNEGDIFQEGDKFAASVMNDLEKRIADAFTDMSNEVIQMAYPVGSIYLSVNNVDPATIFSGTTWERITDKFLLAGGNSYSIGATGGEATHVLSVSEMPSHNHGLNGHVHSLAGHTHYIPSLSGGTNATGNHVHNSKNRWTYFEGIASDPSRHDYFGGGGSILSSYSAQVGDMANNMYENGNHSHTVTTDASNTGGASGNTGGASGNTANSGSTYAHNNMPPYLAINIWKRVS